MHVVPPPHPIRDHIQLNADAQLLLIGDRFCQADHSPFTVIRASVHTLHSRIDDFLHPDIKIVTPHRMNFISYSNILDSHELYFQVHFTLHGEYWLHN
jgi:hypothetical protein